MDESNPYGHNLLIEGNKIKAINVDENCIDNKYKKYDLEGKTLLPGFNDSHMHILSYGISLDMVDLRQSESIEEIQERVSKFIEKKDLSEGEWIFGRGWNHEDFIEKRIPDKNDLDSVSEKYPIAITRTCGHIVSVNSKALELCNISSESYIEGGIIYKNEEGQPNGIMAEKAKEFIYQNQRELTIEDVKNYIRLATKKLQKLGLTTVQSDDLAAANIDKQQVMQAFYELSRDKELPVKVNMQLKLKSVEDLLKFINENPVRYYSDFLSLGPLKIIADGSLGARTAAMREPYADSPDEIGGLIFSKRELEELIDCAYRNNMQTALHAIGDKTIEIYLDINEKLQAKYGKKLRNRIIHCQITDYKLIKRIAKLGLMADIQPPFTASDWKMVRDRLGDKRSVNTHAWKTMMDNGINVSGGSDCPVESPAPLKGIRCAVTRLDWDDKPEGGWFPDQKLSVYDAIKMYTINSAYSCFEKDRKGILKEGYEADIVVLDQDPFIIDPKSIDDIEVYTTIVNGNIDL